MTAAYIGRDLRAIPRNKGGRPSYLDSKNQLPEVTSFQAIVDSLATTTKTAARWQKIGGKTDDPHARGPDIQERIPEGGDAAGGGTEHGIDVVSETEYKQCHTWQQW